MSAFHSLEPEQPSLAALYAFTLVGFALVTCVPVLFGMDSQAVTIPYRAAMLGLAVFVIARWFVIDSRVLAGPMTAIIGALWIALIARVLWDTALNPGAAEFERSVSQFLLLSLVVCFLGSLPFIEAPSRPTLARAVVLIELLGVTALMVLAVLAVAQFRAGTLLLRFSTDVLNPISIGHLAVTVMIANIAGLTEFRPLVTTGRVWLLRYARFGSLALSVVVLVASASKGPMLCAVVIVLILGAREGLKGARSNRALAWIVGGAAVAALVVWGLSAIEERTELVSLTWRFADVLFDESALERLRMFEGSLAQFAEHPLLGSSLVELQTRAYPHNILVESLMMVGMAVTLLLVAYLFATARSSLRLVMQNRGGAWLGLLCIQYTVASMLSGSLVLDTNFWASGLAVLAADAALAPNESASMLPAARTPSRFD